VYEFIKENLFGPTTISTYNNLKKRSDIYFFCHNFNEINFRIIKEIIKNIK